MSLKRIPSAVEFSLTPIAYGHQVSDDRCGWRGWENVVCSTPAELIDTYCDVVDALEAGNDAAASANGCHCVTEYVEHGDLEDILYGLVGQNSEPSELEDLLVFDEDVLIGLGVNPYHAKRLYRNLNHNLAILAGAVSVDAWRTWTEEDVEHTMGIVREISRRVCAGARLLERSDIDPVQRSHAKAAVAFGIAVVGGLAGLAATGNPAVAAAIIVITAAAQFSLEFISFPEVA